MEFGLFLFTPSREMQLKQGPDALHWSYRS